MQNTTLKKVLHYLDRAVPVVAVALFCMWLGNKAAYQEMAQNTQKMIEEAKANQEDSAFTKCLVEEWKKNRSFKEALNQTRSD